MDNAKLLTVDERARRSAAICLGLLLPTLVVSILLALSSPRASRCVTHGEGCSPISIDTIGNVFHLAAVLGILAVAWPKQWLPFRYARPCLVGLQVAAQFATALMILDYA